jgi:hypothetical protein
MRINEELLERKSSGPSADQATSLSPQKIALNFSD